MNFERPSWSDEEDEILIACVREGMQTRDIHVSGKLPARSASAIKARRSILVNAGRLDPTVKGGKPQRQRSMEEAEKLSAMVEAGKTNITIAAELGFTEGQVERVLRVYGIRRNDTTPKMMPPPRAAEIRMIISPWQDEPGGVRSRIVRAAP